MQFVLFNSDDLIITDNSKVVFAKRWKTDRYRTVRRQVQTVVVWDCEGLPYYGEAHEPSCKDQEWRGDRRRSSRRMAPSGTLQFLPYSKLILPPKQIEDSEEDKHRTSWVNFKNAIWHKSFHKLLQSIEVYAVTGYSLKCGDHVHRNIFPFIVILSADYEEQ